MILKWDFFGGAGQSWRRPAALGASGAYAATASPVTRLRSLEYSPSSVTLTSFWVGRNDSATKAPLS